MESYGPIIFIDDDTDDQILFKPLLQDIAPHSEIIFFENGEDAIEFLRKTDQRPFLIISEVSMKRMSGLELRRQIEQDSALRKRAIPFIFFTHPVYKHLVEEAYEMTIQGFFEKQHDFAQMKSQLKAIVEYWLNCLHPNRFTESD